MSDATHTLQPTTYDEVTLGHFSDSHLGLTQYPVQSQRGRNQREVDFSNAWIRNIESICAEDLDLTIHAGDMYDNARPEHRHILRGAEGLRRLAAEGRTVIVIGGNHDMPVDANEPAAIDLHAGLSSRIHLATRSYKVIDLGEQVAAGNARESLRNVVVHLLPHDALKSQDWAEVQPHPGKINILISHCVVGGSELYKRSKGREFALPIDVTTRGWHYVALGHYHKQMPVAVGGFSEANTPIWYSGSTENNGFSDVKDGRAGGERGWLKVTLRRFDKVPTVEPVDLPIRKMFSLPHLDAHGLTAEQLNEAMVEAIDTSDIEGAVVRQRVVNVNLETWGLIEKSTLRTRACETHGALWYETQPIAEQRTVEFGDALDPETGNPLGDLASVLAETLEETLKDDPYKDAVAELAQSLLANVLEAPAPEPCCLGAEEGHEHAA